MAWVPLNIQYVVLNISDFQHYAAGVSVSPAYDDIPFIPDPNIPSRCYQMLDTAPLYVSILTVMGFRYRSQIIHIPVKSDAIGLM